MAIDPNATVAQTAIAWVLHQPGVTANIAGSGSDKHTAENVQGAEVDIRDVAAELEALIQPGA